MKKFLLLFLFPVLLFSQNVKVRTIWLDTSRANIDTSHILSPERFHRTVVFDSLFTVGGVNALIATDTNYFRNFSDIKYFKKTDLDTNRIVTTDKAQSIAGTKTFTATNTFTDSVSFGKSGGASAKLRLISSNGTGSSKRADVVISDAYSGTSKILIPDSSGTFALKEYTLKPDDTTSFRTFSNNKYTPYLDSNRIVTVDKAQSISGDKSFGGNVVIDENASGNIQFSDGTYAKTLGGSYYTGNRTISLPDSSGTLALKEYTLKPSDTVGVAFYNRDNVFDHTNYFTARDIHTSIAVDTIVAKSSGNKLYLQDTVNISGNLKIGSNFNGGIGNYDAGNNASSRSTFIHGTYDSIYSTTTTNGGENYIFGRNNTIGRTNPTGTYGNWLFGQYLRSEGLGLWALGADDDFQKKIIPFEGTIAFVNEPVRHWLSNTMPIYASGSYTWQSPHVKDSMAFSLTYQKAGSSVDSLAYAQFLLEGQREFIIDSKGMITYPDKAVRYLQINGANDNGIHFNARNVSGKAFGNMYLDSGNFYILKGFAGFDSLRGSAGTTTYWNKTGYHSGLGASYMGNLSIGSLNTNGNTITSGAITSTGNSIFGTGTFNGNVYPDATSSSRNLGTLGQGWTRVVIEHASDRAEGLMLRQTAASTATPRIMFDNSTSWAGQGVALYHNSPWTMSFTTGVTAGTSVGKERWRYDTLGIRPSTNAVFNSGSSGLNWLGVYSNNYYNGSTRWMDASRNLTNIGTISSGAITSTGLSTFGTNSGNATIGAGDTVRVAVTGLTKATGIVTVSYNYDGFIVADTAATAVINEDGYIKIRGKYGYKVNYWIGKK